MLNSRGYKKVLSKLVWNRGSSLYMPQGIASASLKENVGQVNQEKRIFF